MKIPSLKLPKIQFPKNVKIPTIPIPGSLGKKLPFSHLLDKFKQLPLPFLKKAQKILVVEIGESWLKLIGIEETGKLRKVSCLGTENIENQTDLDIGLKIDHFLTSHNFKPTHTLISHPSHNLTTRILMLPSIDPKEIKDIVELQAVKQTPYAREEITSGFHIIDKDPSGYSQVLVAIAHRDTSSRYYRIVEFGKLSSERITLSLEGTRCWYQMLREQEIVAKGQVNLLLDVDYMTTELLIFDDDKLVFSRSLGIGAKQIAEQPEMSTEFLHEVHRSMESGNAELKGNKITNLILTGVDSSLKDLIALLTRELNLPCEIIPVLNHFEDRLLEPKILTDEKPQVSLASIAGLGFNPYGTSINLIPTEIVIRKGLESRAKDLALMGSLLLGFIMIVSLIGLEKIYKKSTYLGELKKQYSEIHKDSTSVERLVSKMKLAADINSGQGFLDIFREINEIVPNNITLTAIQYNDKEKSVTLRGLSEEMSAVFQFLTTLESAPHLEQVKTRNVAKRKVADKDMADFEMVAIIGKEKVANANPEPPVAPV
jgi:Tfp pilus assembly PilM family ATPase